MSLVLPAKVAAIGGVQSLSWCLGALLRGCGERVAINNAGVAEGASWRALQSGVDIEPERVVFPCPKGGGLALIEGSAIAVECANRVVVTVPRS